MKASSSAEIIESVSRLLFERGLQTPIDVIIASSGVSRMTFYKYARSKQSLLQQCLLTINAKIRKRLEDILSSHPPSGGGVKQLQEIFMELCRLNRDPEVCGGLIWRALHDFPRPTDAVHRVALGCVVEQTDLLARAAENVRADDPRATADHLQQLAAGAFVTLPMSGPAADRIAWDLAKPSLGASSPGSVAPLAPDPPRETSPTVTKTPFLGRTRVVRAAPPNVELSEEEAHELYNPFLRRARAPVDVAEGDENLES